MKVYRDAPITSPTRRFPGRQGGSRSIELRQIQPDYFRQIVLDQRARL